MAVQAYVLLGGLFGPDGVVTSAGMYELTDDLKKLAGVTVSTYFWSNYTTALAAVEANAGKNRVAIIGYSGGGSRATWLANQTAAMIDLLVAYDPSPTWQMEPLGANVGLAICYFNQAPFMFGLGGGRLTGAAKDIVTIPISEQHLAVQFDQGLHARTVAAVRALT